jgi:DNA-binding XRE family transcriptional regulator
LTPVAGKAEEKVKVEPNNVRKIREGLLMSKAELARRAKLSVLTIDRVEKGRACRMDTKRKIILSLGLTLSDRDKVFRG